MKLLKHILRYKRPHGSSTECVFIHKFLDCLPGIYSDIAGNRIVRIGESPILWSCHTDTVHKKEGLQKIFYKKNMLRSDSNCLGADDAAGIWLMIKMIRRKVPGLYIFHRGEEVGGIGSTHIATNSPELLSGSKYAIALDRRGYTDVITHQGSRCCSDKFAESLAKELDMAYTASTRGSFTDTANYTSIIGECTNLSVGYFSQHSMLESLDGKFLIKLLASLVSLNQNNLLEDRKADECEILPYRNNNFGYNPKHYQNKNHWDYTYEDDVDEGDDLSKLASVIEHYPLATVRTLRDLGVTPDDIKQEALYSSYY